MIVRYNTWLILILSVASNEFRATEQAQDSSGR